MKIPGKCLSFAALVAVVGCVAQTRTVLNQPVGPSRSQASRRTGEGELVVYTARELNDPVASRNPTHSPYTIYGQDDHVLQRVDNRTGSFYQDPVPVSLPAGKYKIEARATNAGTVDVPVVIEEGRTTVVDLDGATLPQDRPKSDDQWVRLPGGQIVGFRAQ
jgi:hypothetical protein